MTSSTSEGLSGEPETTLDEEVWYLALRKLLIPQGPGVKPSSIRFVPGQRFALDGDEPIDIDSMIRTGAIKVYEDSDAEWATFQLAHAGNVETPKRRRSRRGKN
jgi:hypothetical protein